MQTLDNYEGVPALNAQAPQVFIDTMLQLLKDEVPQLTEWAAREQQALDLDEVVYATRSLWVETKVNKLLRAALPAANPVYQPADESRSGGALNAMGGGARRPGNKADPGRSPPWVSAGVEAKRERELQQQSQQAQMGSCDFCDCRGCAGEPGGKIEDCSVFGNAPPKKGATPDNIAFLETTRGFNKMSGGKYD